MPEWSRSISVVAVLVVLCIARSAVDSELPPEVVNVLAYVPPDDFQQASEEMMLLETLLRYALQYRTADCHVGFIQVGFDDELNLIDPPIGLLERIPNVALTLRPVSQARFAQDWGRGNRIQFRRIETKDTREPASIFHVRILKWVDERTTEVSYGQFGGPFDGVGESGAIFQFNGERWIKKSDGHGFIH